MEALLRESEWGAVDLQTGELLVAHEEDGPPIGVVRMVDLGAEGWFIDDVVVAPDRRGRGVGAAMMRAALDGRTGPFFLVCHDERIAFCERLGFALIGEADLPEAARAHALRTDQWPSHPGHVHHLMRG